MIQIFQVCPVYKRIQNIYLTLKPGSHVWRCTFPKMHQRIFEYIYSEKNELQRLLKVLLTSRLGD